MFNASDLNKEANIIDLIRKYNEIKTALKDEDNLLLSEINKWELENDKLDLNEVDDELIEDCFSNSNLNISKVFIQDFNNQFKNLSEESYKTVFDLEDENDIHFKYFEKLDNDSLTQTSLDVFKARFIEGLRNKSLNENWWKILAKYDSNNSIISIINTLKDIRSQFINEHIELDVDTAKKILPYFLKYDLLESNLDIFRTIIKNQFLSDGFFINLLIENTDKIKSLYQSSSQTQKEGFRNKINEMRNDNGMIEDLAKVIDIRKTKDKE